jgi:hypothetical protein
LHRANASKEPPRTTAGRAVVVVVVAVVVDRFGNPWWSPVLSGNRGLLSPVLSGIRGWLSPVVGCEERELPRPDSFAAGTTMLGEEDSCRTRETATTKTTEEEEQQQQQQHCVLRTTRIHDEDHRNRDRFAGFVMIVWEEEEQQYHMLRTTTIHDEDRHSRDHRFAGFVIVSEEDSCHTDDEEEDRSR